MNLQHGSLFTGRLKSLSFLLSAVVTAALVFVTLPQTVPALAEIPERLESQAAVGNYSDGVYVGSSTGYGGTVKVQVTVEGGQIVDITILSAAGETPAYLRRAENIIEQVYLNQTWEVDVISGATYTCKGILGAIQNAITGETVINEAPPSSNTEPIIQESFTEPAAYLDGVYIGSAQGFGGMITVSVTIVDGKLTDLQIVDASAETPSYLNQAMAVVSRILADGSPNVDTVSGATYTSNGIINATKRALSQAAVNEVPEKEEESKDPVVDFSVMPAETLKDGIYTGVGEGYGGDIVVQITVEGGRITAVEIVSAENETPAYFERAKTLLPHIISTQSTQVDAVSGATLSSDGILKAVDAALSQAKETPDQPESSEEEQPFTPPEENETVTPRYADGVYSITGWCEEEDVFRYELTVTVTVNEGAITVVDVVRGVDESEFPEDNERYLNYAINGRERKDVTYVGIPQQIIDRQSTDNVDVVSGATYSSRTILELASELLALAINSTGGAE